MTEPTKYYKPLEIVDYEVVGIPWAMRAMRLPKRSKGDTIVSFGVPYPGPKDLHLASNLVKAGNDHAKAMRGINVYAELNLQVGFLIEFETYRHGVECLSTSSSMHMELSGLTGEELAEQKQADLPDKQYTRILTASYQALRSMYHARRHHRHPDWHILCDWIETLPYAAELIMVKQINPELKHAQDSIKELVDALIRASAWAVLPDDLNDLVDDLVYKHQK